jgi:phage gp29-like protein
MELAPWTAPPGYEINSRSAATLSLAKAQPLPASPPRGRVSRDLPFFDSATFHPESGVTPAALRTAFRMAEQGYPEMQVKLMRGLIEGDGNLRTLFDRRNGAVASKPTVFQPGDASASAAKGARVFEIACRALQWKKTLEHLLLMVPYGYSGAEVEWGTLSVDGRLWIVPVDVVLVPIDRFRIGAEGMIDGKAQVRLDELRIYNEASRPQGEDLAPAKWITTRYRTETLARAGLMRTAAPLAMGKRYGFRDWLVLSERYGIPMPIVKYQQEVDEFAKEVGRLIIQNLGSDGGAVVPHGIDLEIKEGVTVDKPLQAALIDYCNREETRLVNGATDATDSSEGGSYARASIHGDVRFESVADDAGSIHEAIDMMLATPFAYFNGVSAAPCARQQIARNYTPAVLLALADTAKNKLGVDVSKSQIYGDTGLRPPVDDADKAPGAPQPAMPPGKPPAPEES